MHHPTTNGNIKTTASSRGCDAWYYPPDIANDLKDVNLPPMKSSARLLPVHGSTRGGVIPQYTNWDRYIAFMRIIGSMVDATPYRTPLATLFEGTPRHADMAREYRTFLLITADKASNRRDSELFRRYVNSLAHSPKQWFRMRDCDALARFTIAAALACNDLDDVWLSEEQFDMLGEIGITLYDAVAFYKHRSEGETNSTFAYMPDDLRVKAFRQCREVLWASTSPGHEDLTIGRPETNQVITQTRANFKLWNRVDANKMKDVSEEDIQRYKDVLARSEELMFRGLDELLETGGDGVCRQVPLPPHTDSVVVELCAGCRAKWRGFLESFPDRATHVFPSCMNTFKSITSLKTQQREQDQ
ncbi:BcABA3 [Mycena olivaceomarginata]|nr:BcABA3 [Mycena olivaceomarginata]